MSTPNKFLRTRQETLHDDPHTVLSTVLVEPLRVPGFVDHIAARAYQPVSAQTGTATMQGTLPGVVYLHGGGFVGGTLDDADTTARYIAAHTPAVVISIAYSLAPKRPFPAAPEDAHAALKWFADNAASLNVDPQRIAVAGDDAGGNIAAALTLIARDRNGPAIAAQVLLSPMLDPSMTQLGDAERLRSDIKPETCANCYSKYLPTVAERLHPYASPLASRRLHGLPPALIATAECDVLHREAEQYATALIAAGVPTQITRFDGNHADLPTHPQLLSEVVEFLQRRLSASDSATSHTKTKARPHVRTRKTSSNPQ